MHDIYLSLGLNLLVHWKERREVKRWLHDCVFLKLVLLFLDVFTEVLEGLFVLLYLVQGDIEELVLSLSCFNLVPHQLCCFLEVFALTLEFVDLFIVLLFSLEKGFKLIVVPFELLFKADDPHIGGQFLVLLFRLGLEEFELFLNLVHVCFESEPKVILMLAEHLHQFLIVVVEGLVDLVKGAFHIC